MPRAGETIVTGEQGIRAAEELWGRDTEGAIRNRSCPRNLANAYSDQRNRYVSGYSAHRVLCPGSHSTRVAGDWMTPATQTDSVDGVSHYSSIPRYSSAQLSARPKRKLARVREMALQYLPRRLNRHRSFVRGDTSIKPDATSCYEC